MWNPQSAPARILWVDDDENILSSVRRLLKGSPFSLETSASPLDALNILKKEEFSIVVSDQRMPMMSGIELLRESRSLSPVTTRMMVTAFIDDRLVEEAVNEAAVFRFITKPWNPAEIVHDIENGVRHYLHSVEQRRLLREVTRKKKQLEELTVGLGRLVDERTRPAEQSRIEAESKRRHTRELIRFVKDLARVFEADELMVALRKEFRLHRGLQDPVLGYLSSNHAPTLLFFRGHHMGQKRARRIWPSITESSFSEKAVRQFLADELGRPVGKVAAVPLESGERVGTGVPVLFVEHDFQEDQTKELEEFLSERTHAISLAADRVLSSIHFRDVALQWERTFDQIGLPVAIVDMDYRLLRGNLPFAAKGTSARCFEIFAGRDRPCEGCPVRNALSTGRPSGSEISVRGRIYQVQSFPILWETDTKATTAVNSYVDITENRELWSRILQSEKMAALGRLADSLAHELNNPLTGIHSLAQLSRTQLEAGTRVEQDFEEIEKGVKRCQGIVRNFVEFSRGSDESQAVVSLNALVRDTLPFLKSAMRNHRTETNLEAERDLIHANPQLIQQVIFNLVNNACQAMGNSGDLIVATHERGNGFIELEVTDTGPGIPAHIATRIFEPFFTTKGPGQGTGLGLSLSHSIVQKSGGRIELKSQPGVGTTFRVFLPLSKEPA